jgi:hypothetical protein
VTPPLNPTRSRRAALRLIARAQRRLLLARDTLRLVGAAEATQEEHERLRAALDRDLIVVRNMLIEVEQLEAGQ